MPTLSSADIDNYFQRIGYQGEKSPTLETLRQIAFCHATSIPFENLDVLAGVPISLDVAERNST